MTSEILTELQIIKWLLIVFIVAFLAFVFFASSILWGVFQAKNDLQDMGKSSSFKLLAEDLLERGKTDELVVEANLILDNFPNHSYAKYYLAIGLNYQNKPIQALKIFEDLRDNKPDWAESVDPYIDELKQKIKESKPKLV